jgi:hypothetical protein
MVRIRKLSLQQRRDRNRQRMQQARNTSVRVIQGSFHQGDQVLSAWNRGSQCTCMCLMALLTAEDKTPNQWTSTELDTILQEGDKLYSTCRGQSRFVMIIELPKTVDHAGCVYSTTYHDGFCGTLGRLSTEAPFYTLHDAIMSSQKVSRMNFVLMGSDNLSYCIAIINCTDQGGCFVFDSHSRDQSGMATGNGTSVLVRLDNVDSVSAYIHQLSRSLMLGSENKFEVIPCILKKGSSSKASGPPTFYTPIEEYLQNQLDAQLNKQETTPGTNKTKTQQRQQRWLSNPGTCGIYMTKSSILEDIACVLLELQNLQHECDKMFIIEFIN